jgi:hypothetical protein
MSENNPPRAAAYCGKASGYEDYTAAPSAMKSSKMKTAALVFTDALLL